MEATLSSLTTNFEGRSSTCSPQGVLMDFLTMVVASVQILMSVLVGMKSDNNNNNNNNNNYFYYFYFQQK